MGNETNIPSYLLNNTQQQATNFMGQPVTSYLQGQGPLANYGLNWKFGSNPAAELVNNTGSDWFSMKNLFGDKNQVGALPALFGIGSSLMDGWLGMEKLDLAKDSLNFQKDAFSKQFENQRTLTNAELRDRQNARVASNPTAYQSVDDYMKANGV